MKTEIQKKIEYFITKGLGYNTETNFIEGRERRLSFLGKLVSKLLTEWEVHNSKAGLQAHLYELDEKKDFNKLRETKEFFDNTSWYIQPVKRLAFRTLFGELYEFDGNRNDAILGAFAEKLRDKQSTAKLNYLLFSKQIYSK